MTNNEILARWQGWSFIDTHWISKNGYDYVAPPDYLTDSAACMSLMDTLVEKGFTFTLYSELNNNRLFGCCIWEHDKSTWTNPIADAENKPTINQAIVAAVLEVAKKELEGKEIGNEFVY